MADFTNISGSDIYVKDEYGRMVKFAAGETRTGMSDFLFNYTAQATGQNNSTGGSTAPDLEPVLYSAGSAPTNMPGPNIQPNNVLGAGRLDRTNGRLQVAVQLVDAMPAVTDDPGLYSDGSSAWLVAGGAVITIS